jgi:hypothetical protein
MGVFCVLSVFSRAGVSPIFLFFFYRFMDGRHC